MIVGLRFLFKSRKMKVYVVKEKKRLGIPKGHITYTDLDKPSKALFSRRFMIAGKPDYIVETSDGLIPVEVKSGFVRKPYNSHILQLAAYCLLMEDIYDAPVPYGIIVYEDGRQHKINYDYELRSALKDTIKEIRNNLRMGRLERNHDSIKKCAACGYRYACKERLI